MILPKPVLQELGVGSGTVMEIQVENGRVVAVPVKTALHDGWAEAAQRIGAAERSEEAEDWLGFPNSDDESLEW